MEVKRFLSFLRFRKCDRIYLWLVVKCVICIVRIVVKGRDENLKEWN